jgi:hypothetical protein
MHRHIMSATAVGADDPSDECQGHACSKW